MHKIFEVYKRRMVGRVALFVLFMTLIYHGLECRPSIMVVVEPSVALPSLRGYHVNFTWLLSQAAKHILYFYRIDPSPRIFISTSTRNYHRCCGSFGECGLWCDVTKIFITVLESFISCFGGALYVLFILIDNASWAIHRLWTVKSLEHFPHRWWFGKTKPSNWLEHGHDKLDSVASTWQTEPKIPKFWFECVCQLAFRVMHPCKAKHLPRAYSNPFAKSKHYQRWYLPPEELFSHSKTYSPLRSDMWYVSLRPFPSFSRCLCRNFM